MPAIPENFNAMRAGYESRQILALGRLPKHATWIRRYVGRMRRCIEQAVLDAKGGLTLKDAMLVQSVCRHEIRALLAVRWLRLSYDDMCHADRLRHLDQLGRATEARDKTILRLKLDKSSEEDMLALIFKGRPSDILDAICAETDSRPRVDGQPVLAVTSSEPEANDMEGMRQGMGQDGAG